MLETVVLVILSPIVIWLIYWFYTVQHFEKYLKRVPGPSKLPLLGNSIEFGSPLTVIYKMMARYEEYRTNFKIYIGSKPYLLMVEPKDIEFILSSSTILTKADTYSFFHEWIGDGLLTSTGNKWRKHRKVITPAFHFQILEEFIHVFNTQSDVLIKKLENEVGKSSFDVYPYIVRCTLDIICEAAMGTCVNAQNDYDSKYAKSVNFLLDVASARSFSILLGNPLLYPFTKMYREEKQALKIVHGLTNSVIASRKKELLNNIGKVEDSVDSLGRKKRMAFLDLLLKYSTQDPDFTEKQIREEVDTFMFEGHDTTASSITFALYALSKHPEIQEKVYEEIQSIFSDDPSRTVTYNDLQEMKYLEMVIKESLRFYTTIPLVGRTIEEDTVWNGITLPKGLMVIIFIYGAHYSTSSFEDPYKFDPERFNPENSKSKYSFGFVPFSAGPRNCIGQRFAMFEMKTTISKVLRNYELLPAVPHHEPVLKHDPIIKSENGVYIKLRKR